MSVAKAAIVGGDSLLGRELRDQLAERGIQAELKLVGAEDQLPGVISIDRDEPIILTALDKETLSNSRVLFLTGTPEATARAMELIDESGAPPLIVDVTYALEDRQTARLRAPQIEAANRKPEPGTVQVVAHPAAIVVAIVLGRLVRAHRISRAIVHIFEPASERGQVGLNELQQQTRNLFAFKGLEKDVFDAQITFNLLPRYGSEAPASLQDVEHRIERHIATLLGRQGVAPLPSIRLVQAPVFHGYSLSFWVEFAENPGTTAIAEALASADIEVRSADLEPPSNVGSVGQKGVTVGLIEQDRNAPKAVWMWAVADNFRIAVDNAIEIARPVLEEIAAS
jgi:aspartate-semialdehyde dehydrogenase